MRERRSSGAKGGGFKAPWLLAALIAVLVAGGLAVGGLTGGVLAGGVLAAGGGRGPAPPAATAPLFVGFYDAWDQSARQGLPVQLPKLDVFAPLWLTVRGPQGEISVEPDDGVEAMLAARRSGPKVFPLISNAHDNEWDKAAADAVILNPKVQAAFEAQLRSLASSRGFAGYILDFENLSPEGAAGYPAMLAAVRQALSGDRLEVWVTASLGGDQPLKPFADAADAVVVMAYDECWGSSNPGPIAGHDWLEQSFARRLQGLDPHRVVVALASYAYDWPAGGVAKALSVSQAQALAAAHRAEIRRDPASRNPSFAYTDAAGVKHSVWFIDAPAFADQRQLAAAWRPRGYALWRLGLEDPAIWSLPHAPRPVSGPPPAPTAAPLPHPCDPLALATAK